MFSDVIRAAEREIFDLEKDVFRFPLFGKNYIYICIRALSLCEDGLLICWKDEAGTLSQRETDYNRGDMYRALCDVIGEAYATIRTEGATK